MRLFFRNFPITDLEKEVFSRVPLEDGEIIKICEETSFRENMSSGNLFTNLGIFKWKSKKCERFFYNQLDEAEFILTKGGGIG